MAGIETDPGTADIFFKAVVPYATTFHEPVNDALYSAHREIHDVIRGQNVTRYDPDYPIKLVTCLQQVSDLFSHAYTYR